jgi:hypothetical protein
MWLAVMVHVVRSHSAHGKQPARAAAAGQIVLGERPQGVGYACKKSRGRVGGRDPYANSVHSKFGSNLELATSVASQLTTIERRLPFRAVEASSMADGRS